MATNPIPNNMLCAIGENLVSAQLMAHKWPTVNLNSSIQNFKGIDLYCQNGINSGTVKGIQVKTTLKSGWLVGISCGDCADLTILNQKITGPWVFVNVTQLEPLHAEYYILTRQQVIDLLFQSHQWYLYNWDRQPSPKLLKAPAAISLNWMQGKNSTSIHANSPFINPFPGNIFKDVWSNIWK